MEPFDITSPEQLSKDDIEFIVGEWNQVVYSGETTFGVGFLPEPNFKEVILKQEYPHLDIDSFYNFFKVESSSDEEGHTKLKLVRTIKLSSKNIEELSVETTDSLEQLLKLEGGTEEDNTILRLEIERRKGITDISQLVPSDIELIVSQLQETHDKGFPLGVEDDYLNENYGTGNKPYLSFGNKYVFGVEDDKVYGEKR